VYLYDKWCVWTFLTCFTDLDEGDLRAMGEKLRERVSDSGLFYFTTRIRTTLAHVSSSTCTARPFLDLETLLRQTIALLNLHGSSTFFLPYIESSFYNKDKWMGGRVGGKIRIVSFVCRCSD
jgi:hypothetical protein